MVLHQFLCDNVVVFIAGGEPSLTSGSITRPQSALLSVKPLLAWNLSAAAPC